MKKSSPTIAVVIPTYNEEHFIVPCLEAVLAQSLPAHEVIVVDNNSTDRTVELVRQFKTVKLLQENRQGQVFARKTGFDVAQADILVTIDADSRPLPQWLRHLTAQMEEQKLDALSGPIFIYDGVGRWLGAALFNSTTFTMNRRLAGHRMLYGSNLALRRSAWEQAGSELRLDPELWEDLDLALILDRRGARIGTVKAKLVGVSIRPVTRGLRRNFANIRSWANTYAPTKPRAGLLIYGFAPLVLLGSAVWQLLNLGWQPDRSKDTTRRG